MATNCRSIVRRSSSKCWHASISSRKTRRVNGHKLPIFPRHLVLVEKLTCYLSDEENSSSKQAAKKTRCPFTRSTKNSIATLKKRRGKSDRVNEALEAVLEVRSPRGHVLAGCLQPRSSRMRSATGYFARAAFACRQCEFSETPSIIRHQPA